MGTAGTKIVSEIILTPEYKACLAGLALIFMTFVLTTFRVTMKARTDTFRRKYLHVYDEVHVKNYPEDTTAPKFGYPDCGEGFFSEKLTFEQWHTMASGQRV